MQFHLDIHHRYCKDFPCNRQYLTNEIIHYDLNFKPKRKNKKESVQHTYTAVMSNEAMSTMTSKRVDPVFTLSIILAWIRLTIINVLSNLK